MKVSVPLLRKFSEVNTNEKSYALKDLFRKATNRLPIQGVFTVMIGSCLSGLNVMVFIFLLSPNYGQCTY